MERVATLRTLLLKMQSGELPFDPVTVQRIAAFASRLPAADALGGVPGDNSVEGCDALLSTLLAGMTKGAAQALALADKHNIAYQKSSSGAGGGGGGSRGEERMTKRLPKPSFAVAEREKAGGGSASGL